MTAFVWLIAALTSIVLGSLCFTFAYTYTFRTLVRQRELDQHAREYVASLEKHVAQLLREIDFHRLKDPQWTIPKTKKVKLLRKAIRRVQCGARPEDVDGWLMPKIQEVGYL